MRKKNKNWTKCSDALGDILKKIGYHKKVEQYRLWEIWENVVGKQVAQNTNPARWQGTTLIVTVTNASWMQELTYLKDELTVKIKVAVPGIKITNIKYEIGKL